METGIILGILFAIIVLLVIFIKEKVNNSFWQIQIPYLDKTEKFIRLISDTD